MRERQQRLPETRRRQVLISIVAAALAPLSIKAQESAKIWSIGWVNVTGYPPPPAFLESLRQRGWVEGKNISYKYGYAASPADIRQAASQIIRSGVDIIVTVSAGNAEQILQLTGTLPVVVLSAGDLQSTGLIASLSRPGGNLTGTQIYSPELMAKRLQLLKEAFNISRLAVLRPSPLPDGLVKGYERMTALAAEQFGVRTRYLEFESTSALEGLFASIVRERDQAVLVWTHPFTLANSKNIVALATAKRVPVIGEHRVWANAGAVLTYGPRMDDMFVEAAGQVDKILRGAKPGDLPIRQPTTFELLVNLKAAAALGLVVPTSLLSRADEVIK